MQSLMRYRDLVLPLGIIGCLVVILVPLPPLLMDLLLAANITVGVIVLLTTVYVKTPLEFSIFPSLLLATTLARLVLNVATTRLILTSTESGDSDAVGGVIQGFGEFVAGDRIEVGIIIFVIIVLIQFIVITKGATRISEVAARFALDGMPGKQMAIDADLNAGNINEKTAQQRREDVGAQADFYGAMDGASKFVRGDAIAGIVITLVNVAGGLYIGVMRYGMSISDAAELFTKLTIGDGLVSQVPALLISLAAGLLVTRSANKANLPEQFLQQVFSNPKALAVAGGFLCLLIMTNLPTVPMATLGAGCLGLAVVLKRQNDQEVIDEQIVQDEKTAAELTPTKRVEDYLAVDPMELAIGVGLLSLADPQQGGDLMQRITGVRNSMAGDIGIVLPKVRIRDDMHLDDNQYEIRIAGNPVVTERVQPHHLLAIDHGNTTGVIDGEPTYDPTFGGPAVWIDPLQLEQAAIYGYTAVEPAAVLATHLQEIARSHADELLTRDATKHLIDELKQAAPAVVEELIPDLLTISDVQQVLQTLLREDVPIRQLGIILETLGDHARSTQDPIALSEYVRQRLARTISTRYRDDRGQLHVITLGSATEDQVAAGIEQNDRGLFVRMSPSEVDSTCEKISLGVKKLIALGHHPVVLVSPRIRPGLHRIVAASMPRVRILSYNEITQDTQIQSHGVVSD
ncbi:Flagellar biosynthesis protein FlhA [Allorhodopirellula heiligendammensis]|uniref:Flagellar biosynthesis protein FlhA n=2 Tax=Allorhodopirellula heiligendammensis TaxID=2714739 RepID=A0A5C6C066_9BACT|nr:Flagellar biosynthesis protein FlhA [Allorhodopirellula heiligendammensis]